MKRKSASHPAITAVCIGAGSRGLEAYGMWALKHPDRLKFIGVADPNKERIKRFQNLHGVPDELCYDSYTELLCSEVGKIADVCFVCTPDRLHYEPTIAALNLDYDVVLEKPIAPTLEQCQHIERLAKEKNRLVQICHVLRFTDYFRTIKDIVDSGEIGDILHYEHSENVSYWHFGHSFVRGWYKNEKESNPVILSKCCHDLDLIQWIVGEYADEVMSTGDLTFYKPENAPPGSPERCTDGCPHSETCPWYAPRMYADVEPLIRIFTNHHESKNFIVRFGSKILLILLKHKKLLKFLSKIIPPLRVYFYWDRFPGSAITDDYTIEGRMKALREGQYGLCIFKTGNDVMDHQIATYQFSNGKIASLLVHGYSEWEGRELRIMGTKGTLRGVFRTSRNEIFVTDFRTNRTKQRYKPKLKMSGHGGGDEGLMMAMTSYLLGEKTKEQVGITDISNAMESHYMGFAAEKARIQHKMMKIIKLRP